MTMTLLPISGSYILLMSAVMSGEESQNPEQVLQKHGGAIRSPPYNRTWSLFKLNSIGFLFQLIPKDQTT